jgi:hypothetical protein
MPKLEPSSLEGDWTYRSFINQADLVGEDAQKALDLIFGEGLLHFTSVTESAFKAELDFGGGAAMDLTGCIFNSTGSHPISLLITGTGREGTLTAKWVYQYQGYVVPQWPQGVGQVSAIVGTVVRTLPHGTGSAGLVASFVALKKTH